MRGKTCHVVTRVTANGNIYRGDFCVVFACKKFDLFLSSEDLHMLVLTLMPSTQVLHSGFSASPPIRPEMLLLGLSPVQQKNSGLVALASNLFLNFIGDF